MSDTTDRTDRTEHNGHGNHAESYAERILRHDVRPYVDTPQHARTVRSVHKHDWKWIGISFAITVATASFTWAWGQNAATSALSQKLTDQQVLIEQLQQSVNSATIDERADARQINERLDAIQQTLINRGK